MKKLIFLALISLGFGTAHAQNITVGTSIQKSLTNSLKLAVDKNKHIAVNLSDASVEMEGYDGDALLIEAVTNKMPTVQPAEAAGLNHIPLNNRPAEDNVINYKLVSDTTFLYQISISTKCKYLHIKVPNNLYLFSVGLSNMRSDSYLSMNNMKGAFQINSNTRTVKISNITGPFNIMTRGSELFINDIAWDTNATWPIKSLQNVYKASYLINNIGGDVDISLPASIKASLSLNSGQGQIYSDFSPSPEKKAEATPNAATPVSELSQTQNIFTPSPQTKVGTATNAAIITLGHGQTSSTYSASPPTKVGAAPNVVTLTSGQERTYYTFNSSSQTKAPTNTVALNGGGLKIHAVSNDSNIYLRKQQ